MALRNLSTVLLLLLVSCQREAKVQQATVPLQSASANSLYVVGTDFSAGGITRVELATARVRGIFPANPDSVARFDTQENQLVVLNRLLNNSLRVGPADLARVSFEIPFEPNANPQDIAFLDNGHAYVALYHSTRLLRLDLKNKKLLNDFVDLSPWKDADGYPEVGYLMRVGDRVLVTLQRLNNKTYAPWKKGEKFRVPLDPPQDEEWNGAVLLAVDPNHDTVTKAVALSRPNPFAEIKQWNGSLYVAESGVVDRFSNPILDGAIERLDPVTLVSQGIVVEEAELGGDINDFEILDAHHGVAIVGMPETAIVLFDPSTGKKIRTLEGPEGLRFSHVLVDRERGIFYATDRNLENPAIRVYGFDGVEKREHRIALVLPPFRMMLAP